MERGYKQIQSKGEKGITNIIAGLGHGSPDVIRFHIVSGHCHYNCNYKHQCQLSLARHPLHVWGRSSLTTSLRHLIWGIGFQIKKLLNLWMQYYFFASISAMAKPMSSDDKPIHSRFIQPAQAPDTVTSPQPMDLRNGCICKY